MKIDINKKYRYRNGEPARIVCVDAPGTFPVIAIGEDGDPTTHHEDGKFYGSTEAEFDLIEVREPREWKAVVIKQCGTLASYDDGDENKPDYEVIRVREIID